MRGPDKEREGEGRSVERGGVIEQEKVRKTE